MKTIKFLLTTIAMLWCSVMANAYDFEVDGIYYNILSISDVTVEVTYGDKKYSGEVVIPSTVSYKSKTLTITSIGNKAFYQCTSLTTIDIPDSVTLIGRDAFLKCNSLTSVTIPNSVTTIGNFVFWGCKGLTSVVIPNSVTTIGFYAFYGCTGLTSIEIPSSVTSIGNSAFYDCVNLKTVIKGAFYGTKIDEQ